MLTQQGLGYLILIENAILDDIQGFVISDWEGIDRITSPPHSNYSYSVQAGIEAGIDMVSGLIVNRL